MAKAKTSKAFAAALKKKAKQFKKSRKAKPGQFSIPEVDDGNYVARISMKMRMVGSDKKLIAALRWTITRGAFKAKSHTKDIWLDDEDEEREQNNFDELSRCLQVLGYDMDDIGSSDLMDIADEITKEKPLVKIGLKNYTSEAGNKYLNCYFNDIVDDEDDEEEEEDEDEEVEDEEEEEEEVDDEEEEDEEEDEEEEDEEEYESVEKDDEVKYKRKKCTVASSNQRKETCTLKDSKGKVTKNVSWDDVTLLD